MPWPNIHKKAAASLIYLCLMAFAASAVEQANFSLLMLILSPAFALSLFFYSEAIQFRHLLVLGLAARLFMLLNLPALSDDFYRFLWDGLVLLDGYNPYLYTPEEFVQLTGEISPYQDLFPFLNSPGYFSVYPPLSQVLFLLVALLSGASPFAFQLIMGALFIVADVLILYLLAKLLEHFGHSRKWLSLYFLNPYVILEFCGNLHLDFLMVLGLLATIYFVLKEQYHWTVLAALGATAIKPQFVILFPFILLLIKSPYKIFAVGGIYTLLVLISYSPFILNFKILGFDNSLDLYFRKFEFNGSLYLFFRWIGFQRTGYNAIAVIGPSMAIAAATIISALYMRTVYLRKKSISTTRILQFSLWSFVIYLLFSTTVHPWYLAPVLAIGIVLQRKWVVFWSFAIMWSYSFYDPDCSEWHLVLSISSYLATLVVFLIEGHKKREAFGNAPL